MEGWEMGYVVKRGVEKCWYWLGTKLRKRQVRGGQKWKIQVLRKFTGMPKIEQI